MVVIMAGLPGTGKTTLAAGLLRVLQGTRFDKDSIRDTLFAPNHVDYTKEQDDLCVEVMLSAGGYLLKRNRKHLIVLDGRPFSSEIDRLRVIRWADEVRTRWVIIECVCSDATAQGRLRGNGSEHVAGNRDFALYLSIKARFEPILQPHLVVNTDAGLEECIQQCVEYIRLSQSGES